MSASKKSTKIAIIGGGILGLSLAYFLTKAKKDITITIIERAPGLGGLASGFKVSGGSLERYYHHLFKSDTAIQDLMAELGLIDKLQWLPSKMGIYRDNKIYPFSNAIDILKFSPLNIFERLRLGFFSFYLQKFAKPEKLKGISALNWCLKYFGAKVTSVIWQPLLKSKFGDEYTNISMIWLWARIKDRSSSRAAPWSDERLGYLNGGMQTLVDKLESELKAGGVKILTTSSIVDFKNGGKEHMLSWREKTGKVTKERFNKIVVTSAPKHFLDLFAPPEATIKSWNRIGFIGALCGVVVLKHSLIKDYWLSINDPTAPFVAVVEHTNLVGSKHFNGDHILYVGKYLKASDPEMQLPEEQFWSIAYDFLAKLNPKFRSTWVKEKFLFKAEIAQQLVTTDYTVPAVESGIANIYFAHFAQIFPHDRGTNYAVAQAKELAELLLKP